MTFGSALLFICPTKKGAKASASELLPTAEPYSHSLTSILSAAVASSDAPLSEPCVQLQRKKAKCLLALLSWHPSAAHWPVCRPKARLCLPSTHPGAEHRLNNSTQEGRLLW